MNKLWFLSISHLKVRFKVLDYREEVHVVSDIKIPKTNTGFTLKRFGRIKVSIECHTDFGYRKRTRTERDG